MQVAHQKDHITHAVIGGGKTIDFGISSSAEFFNILSSTLYKDQILAVVREVLCNAWDAHIEAGYTHIPVEITLTPEKLMVKDCGMGIHHDDMGPIYGTYGNSTKKNDGMQTGGFGLGCKAPFAYTDHFEVISCHDGTKTIYNLSKSSAQAMGKPGIVPIASFPTQESGLTVSIPIKDRMDFHRFERLIKRIARNGDMNMKLNGTQLDMLGFDTNKANYLVIADEVMENQSTVMIRYGNVIYPVDKVGELSAEYLVITKHLEALKFNIGRYGERTEYHIIFQAPPHSISVTPSRESLSMQEHTVKTLRSLFNGFIDTLNTKFQEVCEEYAHTSVDEAINEVRIGALLRSDPGLPLSDKIKPPKMMQDLVTMAQRYMQSNYPASLAFRKKDIEYRLVQMSMAGLLDRGMVQTYLRHLQSVSTHNSFTRETSDWLQRHVIGRLINKMNRAGVDHKRLYVFDSHDEHAPRNYYNKDTPPLVEAVRACPTHLFNTIPYMRNIVVLSSSRARIKDRAFKHQVFKELGENDGFLFYQTSMKKVEREEALAFFKQSGMNVVDLTFKQPWEVEEEQRRVLNVVPRVRKPVKKGVPSLAGMKVRNSVIDLSKLLEDDALRIVQPEFILQVSLRQDVSKDMLGVWDMTASRYITDLFGDKGAVTNNSAIYDKWIKKGAVKFDDYVHDKLLEAMTTNQNIQKFWAFNPNRAIELCDIEFGQRELVKTVYNDPSMRQHFGLVNDLTDDERKLVYLWEKLDNRYKSYHNAPDQVTKARIHLQLIKLDPLNVTLMDKFKKNPLLNMIDEVGLLKLLRENPSKSNIATSAIQTFLAVLNN